MHSPINRADIVNGAVGPFDDYCDGYGNPGSSGIGYISVLKLSTGTVAKTMDSVLESIVSYDRAEKNDAYAGQINMIAASSFSGLNGAVWGYDLARHDGLDDGSIPPMMTRRRSDGVEIKVFPVAPLLEAGQALFGTAQSRRFPLLPGSHVICATKDVTVSGPTSVWSAIALSIAEDRDRDSSLFIEDVGQDIAGDSPGERENALHAAHGTRRRFGRAMRRGPGSQVQGNLRRVQGRMGSRGLRRMRAYLCPLPRARQKRRAEPRQQVARHVTLGVGEPVRAADGT